MIIDKMKTHHHHLFRKVQLKMHGKELYPVAEKFLKLQKNCLSEYVGTELSLKRGEKSLRVERIAEELGLVDKLIELRRRVEEERGDEIKGTFNGILRALGTEMGRRHGEYGER
jgi:hypothetical protein